MPLLVPRVGKENKQRINAALTDAVRLNVFRVVAKNLHVAYPILGEPAQQLSNPRLVHLDAQKIALRIRNRHLEQ